MTQAFPSPALPGAVAGADGTDGADGAAALDRLQYDQKNRLNMIGVSAWNYVFGTVCLALYALAGTVGWWVPTAFLALTMAGSAVFLTAVRTGWNLRLHEPNLFVAQMVFAGILLLSFLYAVPQLGFIFLATLFVTLLFGLVQFNARQFLVAWLFVGVGTSIVFARVGDQLQLPASSRLEILLLWINLMMVLGRFSVIGAHLGLLRKKLRKKNELLQQSMARIQELADHDELTGVLNRRRFMQLLEEERARAEREMGGFCVAMLDIDHFKQVNDTHGHLVGDRVLQRFCEGIKPLLRSTDRFGRYGGEEFVVLLPVTAGDPAAVAAERMREGVAALAWDDIAPGLRVTASVGVAAYRVGEDTGALLDRVDQAMYEAKRAGRNRVVARMADT